MSGWLPCLATEQELFLKSLRELHCFSVCLWILGVPVCFLWLGQRHFKTHWDMDTCLEIEGISFWMRLVARGVICFVARAESSALIFNLRMLFKFFAQRRSALLRECFETISLLSRVVLFVFILKFAKLRLLFVKTFWMVTLCWTKPKTKEVQRNCFATQGLAHW